MSTLFEWPKAGIVNRSIPKERLYFESVIKPSVKQKIVDEVHKIRWAYKLGEESLRLKSTEAVQEIQVFEIELKGEVLSDDVLRVVDRSIPSPIIFEVKRDSDFKQVQMVAAHKQVRAWSLKVGEYYKSQWVDSSNARKPLPIAIDLGALYEQLLLNIVPFETKPGEGLSVATARATSIRSLEREVGVLERKLRSEPQINRKVELRRILKTKQAELSGLRD